VGGDVADMILEDAVVIVTGGARGVGKAISKAFVDRGAHVVIADMLKTELEQTAVEFGKSVMPIVTDITDADQVKKLIDKVRAKFGRIDVLVNNAGTFSVIGPVWEVDPQKWFRDIKTNLFGSFLLCHAVVKDMVERKSGYVINIVSSGGVGDPHAYSTSYASSKTGLMRLTEGLAREVQGHGIKVFAVAPPTILTEMTKFIMNDEAGKKWRPGFEKIFENGNDAPPEKVAELILNLVSGKADKLTGRYIRVTQDFDELIARADEIVSGDLYTLRIRE